MVLSPLAVLLVAQLGILLLGTAIYQSLKNWRLMKELAVFKAAAPSALSSDAEPQINLDQAERLLNRLQQGYADIEDYAPASQGLCEEQLQLLDNLADCLGLQLGSARKSAPAMAPVEPSISMPPPSAPESDDIITQDQIDSVLGSDFDAEIDDAIELDELGLDEIETTSAEIEADDTELPDDTLQAILDSQDDFDFSDLESELLDTKK
ncbi:hypothetical protein V6U78_08510 [Marinospirillum sp. MEB164]|uniref:Pilus assembly protein FimV n=1 Tax=Marinospirillum alkalitolerans TaxID=3123374 RepID=A0ABW8PYL6_9GAMM